MRNRYSIERRGLAPLEFVLVLPLFLFLLALMINFGYAAYWKIRSQTTARLAVWATREPRQGGFDSNDYRWPDYWPTSASASASGGRDLALGDSPILDEHQVVRGPLLPAGGSTFVVDTAMFDPDRAAHGGSTAITRAMPFFAGESRIGSFHFTQRHDLMVNNWRYYETKLQENRHRRLNALYEEIPEHPELYALYEGWVDELERMMRISARPSFVYHYNLQPLDDDDEFRRYHRYRGTGSDSPDFHPALPSFCDDDLEQLREIVYNTSDRRRGGFIDSIRGKYESSADPNNPNRGRRIIVRGVPERMTDAFIRLYENILRDFDDPNLPPPPFDRAQVETNKVLLEAFKERIEEFTNQAINSYQQRIDGYTGGI